MKIPDVDFCATLARETCALCGAGYGTSDPMLTREHYAWICPSCVRECFLRLTEERIRDKKSKVDDA